MTRRSIAIFDLGGVLIDFDPRLLYRKLLPDEEAVEQFLDNVCTLEWSAPQDKGSSLGDGIAELVHRHPDEALLIEAWRDRFTEMMLPIEGTICILQELREREIPLYVLSKWGAETFEMTRPLFPLLEWFNGMTISGHVGLVKPDPRIYQRLFDDYQINPGAAVFIDDKLDNVDAARLLGIHGVHFGGEAELRAELQQLGLLER